MKSAGSMEDTLGANDSTTPGDQFEDEQLQQMHQLKPLEYPNMDMGNDVQLIC
jgi:hypothetical protein